MSVIEYCDCECIQSRFHFLLFALNVIFREFQVHVITAQWLNFYLWQIDSRTHWKCLHQTVVKCYVVLCFDLNGRKTSDADTCSTPLQLFLATPKRLHMSKLGNLPHNNYNHLWNSKYRTTKMGIILVVCVRVWFFSCHLLRCVWPLNAGVCITWFAYVNTFIFGIQIYVFFVRA